MYTSSITIDSCIDALANFVQLFAPTVEIVQSQINRVSMPPNPCIILTPLLQTNIDQPYINQNNDETANIEGAKQCHIQIDFYGNSSGDYCTAVAAAFTSQYAYEQFPDEIKPLYSSDGIQSPLITGEEQYESRWTLTVYLQYNPIVIIPQQSALELNVDIDLI